ncbi:MULTISPECIES: universal stress protein [unclassified Pseudofrankia]|uniref:universal stress protein n=1 Tax=unclassified Pseudofrankia TaxID=2994372 RepID=UPI0008D94FD5|nr:MULTISPECIES: universal stress protein [unclassified Pseudofrankia]MDT3440338.1 universal stress protein [Pseudofrankia sp. BMG5.37]OHV73669.1 universal stress protein UspA [Pseudofrankia sp. BMG5.36]
MADGTGVLSVERFGPVWNPGPFELGTDGPGTVVVGVDGSRTALRAASYAAGVARRQRARLVVVYVTMTPGWEAMAPMAAGAIQQAAVDVAAEIRDIVAHRAEELGLSTTFVVRFGDPLAALRRTADEMHADMVVVGASESAGHRIVGSLATRLVRAGKWPVTVVP